MRKTQAGFKTAPPGELTADLLVRFGPTVKVDIGLRPRTFGDDGPDLEFKGLKALIDTGASDNCIDSGVATRAKLPIMDQRVVSGIGGATKVNMYMGRVYIPSLKTLLFQSFAGVELESGGQWHQAILGRSFLRPFTLKYYGPNGSVIIEEADVTDGKV
jgi:hypothetical protein